MTSIPQIGDPTLDAMNNAIANRPAKYSTYLGMGAVGEECERKLWYQFRRVAPAIFSAKTLKGFEDGHATEALLVSRLKAVPGIELLDKDPNTSEQWKFLDFQGHFMGFADGKISGLLQAPKTEHIFEAKCSAKWTDLDKAKKKVGEKLALMEWNAGYYAQAVLYMDYADLDRHYLVCASPGGREETSVRTDADPAHAARLREKAKRVIYSSAPLPRISEKADFFKCKWCDFSDICHNAEPAERNCRTCLHSSIADNGLWLCEKNGHLMKPKEQSGCDDHLYLPGLVPGEQIDAGADWVEYMVNGKVWRDGKATKALPEKGD